MACKEGAINKICNVNVSIIVGSNFQQIYQQILMFRLGTFTEVSLFLVVHESVYRDIIMNTTNEMQLYRLIYYS